MNYFRNCVWPPKETRNNVYLLHIGHQKVKQNSTDFWYSELMDLLGLLSGAWVAQRLKSISQCHTEMASLKLATQLAGNSTNAFWWLSPASGGNQLLESFVNFLSLLCLLLTFMRESFNSEEISTQQNFKANSLQNHKTINCAFSFLPDLGNQWDVSPANESWITPCWLIMAKLHLLELHYQSCGLWNIYNMLPFFSRREKRMRIWLCLTISYITLTVG